MKDRLMTFVQLISLQLRHRLPVVEAAEAVAELSHFRHSTLDPCSSNLLQATLINISTASVAADKMKVE